MSEAIADPTLPCATCRSTRWIIGVRPPTGRDGEDEALLVVTCAHGHPLSDAVLLHEDAPDLWVEIKPL